MLQVLSMVMTILVLQSCRCVSGVTSNVESQDVQVLRFVDTIYQHDSIFIREIVRGDTVYLTRTEWRDRWRTQLLHDTVHHTEFVEKIIEKPPEKYVPKFYKGCAWALGIIVLLAIGYALLKLRMKWRV